MKPLSTATVGKGSTSASCDKVKVTLNSDICKSPAAAVSVFDGKKVVLDAQKKYISFLWAVIQGKLSRSDVDCASSLEDEVKVIIREMDCKDVDIYPLRKLLNTFFDLAISYDQACSTLHGMDVKAART